MDYEELTEEQIKYTNYEEELTSYMLDEQQKQEAYKTLKSDIQTQKLEYGSQKAISFLNKKVGVE